MKYREPLFRPPAEADSLIFQVAYGCPHNGCRFCGMYKGVVYRRRDRGELLAEIAAAGRRYPETGRVFLADGDVMALSGDNLIDCLEALNAAFSRLARVNLYANGSSIAAKSDAELRQLRDLKLNTLYVGLESGCQPVLDGWGKTEAVEIMIAAVVRAQEFGFRASVMILLGLGGRTRREEHIEATAAALNRMQPRLLAALRYIALPGLPPPDGYHPASEYEAVDELRRIVSGLKLERTVFRADHSSNPMPLAGRFPADRERLLAELEAELASGLLDRRGPGRTPLFL